jgi:hypothetical protein
MGFQIIKAAEVVLPTELAAEIFSILTMRTNAEVLSTYTNKYMCKGVPSAWDRLTYQYDVSDVLVFYNHVYTEESRIYRHSSVGLSVTQRLTCFCAFSEDL